MAGARELEALKAAYRAWSEQGAAALPVWRGLLADDFRLASIDDTAPGLSHRLDTSSADHAIRQLGAIFEEWEMDHYTPEHFVCEGESIAMFGRCAYVHKKTRRKAEVRIACLWRFRDGKAVEMTEIFDTARAVAAAIGQPIFHGKPV